MAQIAYFIQRLLNERATPSGGIARSARKKTAYFITSVFVAAVHAEGIGAACDEIEQLGRGHKLVDVL